MIDCGRCELQGLADVLVGKLREVSGDLGGSHALGDHADHGGHRDPCTANAGNARHDLLVGDSPLERHDRRVPRPRRVRVRPSDIVLNLRFEGIEQLATQLEEMPR